MHGLSNQKQPWRLSQALFLLVVLLSAFVGVALFPWSSSSPDSASLNYLDPKIQELNPEQSAIIRATLISILRQDTAEFLDVLGNRHQFLKKLAEDVRSLNAQSRSERTDNDVARKRGLLDDLTGAFGSLGSNVTSSIGSTLGSAVNGLGNLTLGALAEPALYLGKGVGMGTAQGLNLSSNSTTSTKIAIASSPSPTGVDLIAQNLGQGVASGLAGSINISSLGPTTDQLNQASSALGQGLGSGTASGLKLSKAAVTPSNQTGLSGIAGNLGSGLTSSLFGQIDFSKLTTGLDQGAILDAVTASGTGLGEGAAQGLKLTSNKPIKLKARAGSTAALNFSIVAQGFTRSLSSSFLGSVDLKTLTSQFGTSNITSMIGPSIVSAGSGFGQGAAVGLGIQSAVDATTPSGAAGPAVVKNFAYSLTTSFLGNGALTGLQKQILGSGVSGQFSGMIGPAAEGFGSGLGQGAAVGLGLRNENSAITSPESNITTIARNFAYGLTASFLANDTASKLVSSFGSVANSSTLGVNLQSISFGQVAEGFGRGLVCGAGESINNAGGVQEILNGANAAEPSASTASFNQDSGYTSFNDSIGGAATGFGRGLGGEGVNLVLQLLRKSTESAAPVSTSVSNVLATSTQSAATIFTPPSGNLSTRSTRPHKAVDNMYPSLARGDINVSALLTDLNITIADAVIQTSVDTLTCDGIGGLVEVFLGLIESNAIKIDLGSILKSALAGRSKSAPGSDSSNTTFTIKNSGNTFTVNPISFQAEVNGVPAIKLAILLILHIVFAILVYFVAIPLVVVVDNIHAITLRLGRPGIWAKLSRFNRLSLFLGLFPLGIIATILGIASFGSSGHFRTPHGILGLLGLTFTVFASILEIPYTAMKTAASKRFRLTRGLNLSLLLLLAVLLFITGLADIRTISLCIASAVLPGTGIALVSFLIIIPVASALVVVLVRMLFDQQMQSGVLPKIESIASTGIKESKTKIKEGEFRQRA